MELLTNILNYMFIHTNNKENNKKFQNIEEFNSYIKRLIEFMNSHPDYDFFSNLTDEDKSLIKNIIFNYGYPRKLRKYALRLYDYTDIENLLFCALNLCSIELERSFQYKQINGSFIVSDGCYYSKLNKMRYHTKTAIPHEFMHMSSRSIITKDDNLRVGFGRASKERQKFVGINEGYTEMISRRIFFDEDYDGHSYTTNVFAMRLFELLYDNRQEMEKDYLRADYESLKNHFLKFGTEEEFLYLASLLEVYEWETKPTEKKIVLKFIKEIIKRTADQKKIDEAEEISEEFEKVIYKRH
ncbi:MAG: hypothetical protein IKJ43_01030 [Bacilli bacterium]|nr:hypothetical protein [Bacilli bacterium]